MAHKRKRKPPTRRKLITRFLLVFFGVWAVLWAVPYMLRAFPPGVQAMCPITASWLGKTLNLLGFRTTVDGVFVSVGRSGLTIIAECTGYTAVVLFLSVVVAYPSPLSKKLIGLALGVPLILAFNLFRLVVMAIVFAYKPQYFEIAHLYFWQIALVIFVVGIVVLWIEKLVGHETTTSVSP